MKQYNVNTKEFIPEESSVYLVGIDTGVKNGISVYDIIQEKFVFCKSFEWWDLIEFFQDTIFSQKNSHEQFQFIIEDIIANKPTFQRGMLFAAIKSKNPKQIGMSIGIFDKCAQDVGRNKEKEANLLELFNRKGFTIHKYPPKKNSKTKLRHEEFLEETGITTRLNEHTRDASMLIKKHLSQ